MSLKLIGGTTGKYLLRGMAGLLAVGWFALCLRLLLALHHHESLRVEPGMVDGRIFAGVVALALVMLGLTYACGSTAAVLAINAGHPAGRRIAGIAGHGLRIALLAQLFLCTVPLSFRVTERHVHVLLDEWTVNDGAYVKELLDNCVSIVRRFEQHRIVFDSPQLERLVRRAVAGEAINSLLSDFRTALQGLGELSDRLTSTGEQLHQRRGDQVFVVSGHRLPGSDIAGWPLDQSRIGCRWMCVNKFVTSNTTDRPQVLSLIVTHDPGAIFSAIVEMQWPTSMPRPRMQIELFAKDGNRLNEIEFDPVVAQPGIGVGAYRDRLTYLVALPRQGNPASMTIRLKGTDPRISAVNLPEFTRPIPLGQLIIEAQVDATPATDLAAIIKLVNDQYATPKRPVRFLNPLQVKDPRAARWIVGNAVQLTQSLPASSERIVEIISGTLANITMTGPCELVRLPASYRLGSWRQIWPSYAATTGLADYVGTLTLPASAEIYAGLEAPRTTPQPVVFRRDPVKRPNHWTVVVPPISTLDGVPATQRVAIVHTLMWTASLASLGDGDHRPVTQRIFLNPSEIGLATETGPRPVFRSLAAQVWDCFSQPAVQGQGSSANSLAGAWVQQSVWCLTAWIVVLIVLQSFPRCYRGLRTALSGE